MFIPPPPPLFICVNKTKRETKESRIKSGLLEGQRQEETRERERALGLFRQPAKLVLRRRRFFLSFSFFFFFSSDTLLLWATRATYREEEEEETRGNSGRKEAGKKGFDARAPTSNPPPKILFSLYFCLFFNSVPHLLNRDLALHSSALVRLAVVVVLPRSSELHAVGLSGRVQVVLVREGFSVDPRGDRVLVEHDVVREAGVVLEGQRVAGLDRDRGGVEDERARVGAELDGRVGVGSEGEREARDGGGGALDQPVAVGGGGCGWLIVVGV